MQKQIQQDNDDSAVKVTVADMEGKLGDSYKRCWAVAFKLASKGIGFDEQVEELRTEFNLLKPQAQWFVTGANTILLDREVKQARQKRQSNAESFKEDKQRELTEFADYKNTGRQQNYTACPGKKSLLEELDGMSNDTDFMEYWEKQGVPPKQPNKMPTQKTESRKMEITQIDAKLTLESQSYYLHLSVNNKDVGIVCWRYYDRDMACDYDEGWDMMTENVELTDEEEEAISDYIDTLDLSKIIRPQTDKKCSHSFIDADNNGEYEKEFCRFCGYERMKGDELDE